jgi:hypothetical protein
MGGSQMFESLNNTCAIWILFLFPVNVGYSAVIFEPAREIWIDKSIGWYCFPLLDPVHLTLLCTRSGLFHLFGIVFAVVVRSVLFVVLATYHSFALSWFAQIGCLRLYVWWNNVAFTFLYPIHMFARMYLGLDLYILKHLTICRSQRDGGRKKMDNSINKFSPKFQSGL